VLQYNLSFCPIATYFESSQPDYEECIVPSSGQSDAPSPNPTIKLAKPIQDKQVPVTTFPYSCKKLLYY